MKISVATVLFLLFVLLVLGVVVATAPAQSPAAPDDELETFVPTEKLPADSAISFPVDI